MSASTAGAAGGAGAAGAALPSRSTSSSSSSASSMVRNLEQRFLPHAQHNGVAYNFLRTMCSIVAGCVAGVLGLTGWAGIAMYTLSVLLSAAVLVLLIGRKPLLSYFSSSHAIVTEGFVQGLMSFLLFWTYVVGDDASRACVYHLDIALAHAAFLCVTPVSPRRLLYDWVYLY